MHSWSDHKDIKMSEKANKTVQKPFISLLKECQKVLEKMRGSEKKEQ